MSQAGVSAFENAARSRAVARVLFLGVIGAWFVVVAVWVFHNPTPLPDPLALLPWIAAIALMNLLPLSKDRVHFAADVPVALAASLVLEPFSVLVVTLVGAFDPREFRREVTPTTALFNRVQVSAADTAGAYAVHILARAPSRSPWILGLAVVFLGTSIGLNTIL